MLILTRRVGETLIIGDDVQVTVLGVKGNQVRLGINAPKEIKVNREEIHQKILAEKESDNDPVSALELKIKNAVNPIKLVSLKEKCNTNNKIKEKQKIKFEKENTNFAIN